MIFFPNAKINLGLWITSKRQDSFHNIESVFYPIGLKDACEFVVDDSGSDSDKFTQTGIPTDCSMDQNLVIRAVNILRADFNIPALKIHLHKVIPPGAGLGGGSADASFMLKYLNRYFELGLNIMELNKYACRLGSDCPFFIENTPALATGRGEILSELEAVLNGKFLVLINPGIHISTADAYSAIKPKERSTSLKDIYSKSPESWKDHICNDFEEVIFKNHPLISDIKKKLYRQGALYSSMTGSGSSVYGIFRDKPPHNIIPDQCLWSGKL